MKRADSTRRGRAAAIVPGVLLAVQCAVVAAVVAWQFPALWAARWAQDDAYVSFRYARHLVEGHGLVYNPGARVEGYTNFLWTILSAFPMAIGAEDPLPFMHLVSAALWGGSYLVLLLLGIRLARQGVWAAPLGLIPLAYHWSFNMWFFSGMETPLVSFLTILVVFFFTRDPARHPWTLFWASLSAVALTMTRPDGVVVVAALAVAGLALYGPRLAQSRQWRTYLLLPALPMLLVYLPFNAWRVYYYGSFYPNTYYTKVAYLTFYERGWEYLLTYLRAYGLVPYLALPVAGALLAPRETASRTAVTAFLVTACVAFYVVRLGGDFMEWRFVTPVTGIFYPAVIIGAGLIAQQIALFVGGRRARAGAIVPNWARVCGWVGGAVAAAALTMTTRAATPDQVEMTMGGQETIGLLRRYGDPGRYDWRTVAHAFDAVLPRKVHIATTSAGIIPFFCDRPCLDLHGLTDPEIARTPVDPGNRGRMGHEHWLEDYDKIRARGVDILLPWADPKEYPLAVVQEPRPNFEMVSVRLGEQRYVEFIILNHAAVDREAMKRDPRLVLFGSIPVASKHDLHARPAAFADYVTIDRLDWENGVSEAAHEFVEQTPPENPRLHVWHTKFLRYRKPFDGVLLEDGGRRAYVGATWQVHNVRADRELILVARYDRTGGATYRIEVNGAAVPEELAAPGGEESWDEAWVRIPAALLVDGANDVRMVRVSPGRADIELYYMWFLQAPSADDGALCAAPLVTPW